MGFQWRNSSNHLRIKQEDFYDIISGCTTISKGAVIAVFFAARFFNQREGRPASGQEEPLLGSDAQYVPT